MPWNIWSSSQADNTKTGTVVPPSPSVAASPYWFVPVEKPNGFSPFVAFCFTINYILGTGFLTIPWAFVQGGLALSTILLIVVAVAADISKDYLLETMARAEAMLDSDMRWIKREPGQEEKERLLIPPTAERKDSSTLLEEGEETNKDYGSLYMTNDNRICVPNTPVSSQPNSPDPSQLRRARRLIETKVPKNLVKERKFEVNALCRLFLGKTGANMFTSFICLYVCGLLWAYTSVFSSAMARALPIFADGDEGFNYLCYAIVFGLVVVPLSCLELDEQVTVQVVLTGCRFLMLFLMLWTNTSCAEDMGLGWGNEGEDEGTNAAPMFRPSRLHKMLPIVVVANMYHHSIPGLSHPVADKKKLGPIFQATTIFTTVAYAFLGVAIGSAFGDRVEQSSNLNWKGYHGGTGTVNEHGEVEDVAWWAKAISFYIICFPAIDVVSAFPLNAITVGNNMFGAFYGSKFHEVENNRLLKTYFRLLASVPPIILGIMVRDLGLITDYAGTAGFAIGLSFPAILFIKSTRMAKKKNHPAKTYYTSYGSLDFIAQIMFWIGIMFLVGVFLSLTFIKG